MSSLLRLKIFNQLRIWMFPALGILCGAHMTSGHNKHSIQWGES